MIYEEIQADLFTMPDNYYLAHCISADFGMGKGIVVEFNKRFNMKNKLVKRYENRLNEWDNEKHGECILEGKVFNLITKRNYWNKPVYDSLIAALKDMRFQAINNNIKFIAMPMIGCGLDRLNWIRVSYIIQKVFSETDITIVVCMDKKNYNRFSSLRRKDEASNSSE